VDRDSFTRQQRSLKRFRPPEHQVSILALVRKIEVIKWSQNCPQDDH
jgi:hypothetical protein